MRSDAAVWLRPVSARAALTSAAVGFVICFMVCNVVMMASLMPPSGLDKLANKNPR